MCIFFTRVCTVFLEYGELLLHGIIVLLGIIAMVCVDFSFVCIYTYNSVIHAKHNYAQFDLLLDAIAFTLLLQLASTIRGK